MMRHRHLDYPTGTPPEELPTAAVADLLDRGDLLDWKPLADAVARHPYGEVSRRISTIVDASPMYGTSPLWRAWIARCRTRAGQPRGAALRLAELRRVRGMTQSQVAGRMGISQSDVSKIERRSDVLLSTLRDYLAAVDVELAVMVKTSEGATTLRI